MIKIKILKKMRELKNKNKIVSKENQELALQNYYTQKKIKEYKEKLNYIQELIGKFDYHKSNSVFIIRQIKDQFNS